jgi:hypothetical protein
MSQDFISPLELDEVAGQRNDFLKYLDFHQAMF